MPFTDSFLIEYPTVGTAPTIVIEPEFIGFPSFMVDYEEIVFGPLTVYEPHFIAYPSFDIGQEIEMAENDVNTDPHGCFYDAFMIHAYALAAQPGDDSFLIVLGTIVDFGWTPRYGRAPLTVTFTDLSSPVIDAWYWTFGDGEHSIAQNPVHIYKRPGKYNVTLRVQIGTSYFYHKKTIG